MKIPDLTLPLSQAVVAFRDDDELSGETFRLLRKVLTKAEDAATEMADAALAVLIEKLDIPGMPGAPLPSIDADAKVVLAGLHALKLPDTIALHLAVQDFARYIVTGTRPALPKAPPTASDSSSGETAASA